MPEKGRILIIDDDRQVVYLLSSLFKHYHEVHSAKDAGAAIAILKETEIDVVTLDITLPGMPGNELLPYIRTMQPSAEVIVVTGCATPKTTVAAVQHGAYDFFLKPFSTIDLLYTVQAAMRKKRTIEGHAKTLRELEARPEVGGTVAPLLEFFLRRKWVTPRKDFF